jgi:hypothetical protein
MDFPALAIQGREIQVVPADQTDLRQGTSIDTRAR